ncbi:hypothetical protein GCM10010238_31400 [Streptomyces griseoviridis]|uniref:Uncharacterized protein n=1 Tax=Streptomyces griseoviridis TaxID=45398 RepID=A0A918GJP2_STRGD|nr:hypothetical protein GCM10010238_31400 [Streptomyces niveoruber]
MNLCARGLRLDAFDDPTAVRGAAVRTPVAGGPDLYRPSSLSPSPATRRRTDGRETGVLPGPVHAPGERAVSAGDGGRRPDGGPADVIGLPRGTGVSRVWPPRCRRPG